MLTTYKEPEYKLAKLHVIDDNITIYTVLNKYFHREMAGEYEDCLAFLKDKGIDITKYKKGDNN